MMIAAAERADYRSPAGIRQRGRSASRALRNGHAALTWVGYLHVRARLAVLQSIKRGAVSPTSPSVVAPVSKRAEITVLPGVALAKLPLLPPSSIL